MKTLERAARSFEPETEDAMDALWAPSWSLQGNRPADLGQRLEEALDDEG